jgi:hypothetical protein
MVSEVLWLSGLEFDPRSAHFLIKKVEFKHMVGGPIHYSRFKPKWALAWGDVLEIIKNYWCGSILIA